LTERIPVLGQALWMTDAAGRERFVVHSAIPVRGGGGVEGAVVLSIFWAMCWWLWKKRLFIRI
jgi:hypothetical protein